SRTGLARSGRQCPSRSVSFRCLGGGLHRLLVLAHLGQGFRRDDVGDTAIGTLIAIDSGGLAPSVTREAILLAEERQEDLRLLLAESRQLLQSPQNLSTVRIALRPQRRGIPAPGIDELLAEHLHAGRHGTGEPM